MKSKDEINEEKKLKVEFRTRFSASELLGRRITEPPYLIDKLIPKVGLFAIAGSSDCGKSSLLRQLSICVAVGAKDFIGYKINDEPVGVLYISTEDDMDNTSAALNVAFSEHIESDHPLLENLIFEFDEGDDCLQYLENALKRADGSIKLVIIDAYSDVLKGDSNRFESVRGLLNEFKKLAVRYQCAIGLLHHLGKGKEKNTPDKSSILGSQGFEAKMRIVLELRNDPNEADVRYFSILKANFLSDAEKRYSHKLVFENMLFESTGEVIEKSSLGSALQSKAPAWLEEAIELQKKGMTIAQVSQALGKTGYPGTSKSTVGRYLKNNK